MWCLRSAQAHARNGAAAGNLRFRRFATVVKETEVVGRVDNMVGASVKRTGFIFVKKTIFLETRHLLLGAGGSNP
jgi:hypothetical protein